MKISLGRLIILVFVLVTTVSLSMPIHSSPEPDGNDHVPRIDHPNLAPELRPHDLAKRGIIGAVVDVVKMIIKLIKSNPINSEKHAREKWTGEVIAGLEKKNPEFNYVICHTKHTFTPTGEHTKEVLAFDRQGIMKLGGEMKYEVYTFHAGTFKLLGDGGSLNWAYSIKDKTHPMRTDEHKHVTLVYT